MARRLTVSQLNSYIKGMFFDELLLHDIEVCGEITEFQISNGNTFFTITENGCLLSCRKFSLHEPLPIGLKVVVKGSISFYEKGGRVNLVVKTISPYGEGEQHLKLLQLKKQLEADGCFTSARALPKLITNVALITSATGAVMHDFISVNKSRHNINLAIFDSRVQGEGADVDIINALKNVEELKERFDCVIIARGGGANADLSCFNSEALARYVASFCLPVISAVGHETDYTLCDLCASLRAGTPSIAAEAISKINDSMLTFICSLALRINRLIDKKQALVQNRLMWLSSRLCEVTQDKQERKNLKVQRLADRLFLVTQNLLQKAQNRLSVNEELLKKLNPIKILKSGYALAYKGNIKLQSVKNVSIKDEIDIVLFDGKMRANVTKINQLKEGS